MLFPLLKSMEEHFQSFPRDRSIYFAFLIGLRKKKVKTGLHMPSAAEQMAANLSWNSFGKAKDLQRRIFYALGSFNSLQNWNIYTCTWY